jgi:SAM-dependent methyltransferase
MGSQESLRFPFAQNWARFRSTLSVQQRLAARNSLRDWLGDIRGATFVDVGAGSGIFATAAAELGAHVRAFDFDPLDPAIERGDVLDVDYMRSLGAFDIVYAWGVLHHTGDMWRALENVCELVGPQGRLLISIYNDQGWKSPVWRSVKRTYNRLPPLIRPVYVGLVAAPFEARAAIKMTLQRRNYLAIWRTPKDRGMTKWRDLVDWVGGYPFAVAKPEEVFAFCHDRGFQLERIRTKGASLGCNEFLFERTTLP